MNCFDVLSKDTALPPRLFLEASAGTGKTFTIEHLVIRLLVEKKIPLDKIVVVTFTKAATRELKERIQKRLEAVLQGEDRPSYLDKITAEQKNILKEALEQFSQAPIFTIHGFCHHLLKQFAVETGSCFNLTEWESYEEEWELKEFLRSQTVISPGQVHKLLRFFAYDLSALLEKLKSSQVKQPSSATSTELLEEVNQSLSPFFNYPVQERFDQLKLLYKKMTAKHFSHQAAQLEKALLDHKLSQATWEEWITENEFFLDYIHPSYIKAKAIAPKTHTLFELHTLLVPKLKQLKSKTAIFNALASSWGAHYQALSEKKGKVVFDQLLQKVHSALLTPSFTDKVRLHYDALIVDEFQDTDPLQWDIFKTLFINHPHKIAYFIGDPKQSIYGFRKADIYTYIQASYAFAPEHKAALSCNFRSHSQLIDQINALFCQRPWMELPQLKSHLGVPVVKAHHEGEGQVHFMVAQARKTRLSRWPCHDLEKDLFFPFITQQILACPSHETIAILVKDRYQARRMHLFLQDHQIFASLDRKEPLKNSLAFEWLEELIDVMIHPNDVSCLKKMLLGPFAKVPFHLLSSELLFFAKRHFFHLIQLWNEKGFAPFFSQFLQTEFYHAPAFTVFYHAVKSTDFSDFFTLISFVSFSFHPDHLKLELQKLKQQLTKDRIQPALTPVQIMTVHASKGLEFDTVFALGLASRTLSAGDSEEDLHEVDAEKMRQLYVALTRAKKNVYIPIIEEETPSYEAGQGSAIELFMEKTNFSFQAFPHTFLEKNDCLIFPVTQEKQLLIPPKQLPAAQKRPPVLSFSSLAHAELTYTASNTCQLISNQHTGNLIHRVLERYFNQEGELKDIIDFETKNSSLADQSDLLYHLLQPVLFLDLGGFCLHDIDRSCLQTEMEFFYPAEEGLMVGFIDLCFIYNKKLYAIDWKSNLIPQNVELPATVLMKDHDYFLQGKIYEEAMIRYLEKDPSLSFGQIFFIFIRGPLIYPFSSKN